MTVHLTSVQEQRLHHLAAQWERTPDGLAQEAIDKFLDYQESLIAAAHEGEESAERDGWLSHEQVDERFLTSKEQFLAAVGEGRAAAERGELHDHEEVMAMIDRIVEHG